MTSILLVFIVWGICAFIPNMAQAKGGDEQAQIILLNDSASALEDTDPGLSKMLTDFANEKEKDWEDKNANKVVPLTPLTDEYKKHVQQQIKLLKRASLAVGPTYPLIAKGLEEMAHDLSNSLEIKK